MTSSELSVYAQLLGMGVDEPISKEASRRFREIEQAANWAFDHGQTVRDTLTTRPNLSLTASIVAYVKWLSDNNAATMARFGTATSDDLVGPGTPPHQTHNNSPNVSPLIGPQETTAMEIGELPRSEKAGIDQLLVTKKPNSNLVQDPEEAKGPFGKGHAHHHNKTYGKKSRASFGSQSAGVQQTPVTAHRQLPPAPPIDCKPYNFKPLERLLKPNPRSVRHAGVRNPRRIRRGSDPTSYPDVAWRRRQPFHYCPFDASFCAAHREFFGHIADTCRTDGY